MRAQTGKKLLSLFMVILMITTSIPFVFAESDLDIGGRCGKNLFWKLDDQGKLTIFGSGEMQFYDDDDDEDYESYDSWSEYRDDIKTVVIESGATSIANYAFEDCDEMTSISIPNTLISIGRYAFGDCYSLASITIPASVTTIGYGAFNDCDSLKTVTVPAGVTKIEDETFYNCDELEHVYLPNEITEIGDYAFSSCGELQEAPIPDSVKTIGDGAFRYCYSLTNLSIPASVESIGEGAFSNGHLKTISVASTNRNYISVNNALLDIAKTKLLQYPTGNETTTYTVPAETKTIGDYAFYSADSLESISLQNVETVGDHAFADSDNLQLVTMNKAVTIGGYAFVYCYSLANVYVSNTLREIGDEAFLECESLLNAPLPEGVNQIGSEAFRSCESLASVVIPASVSEIGDLAFNNCPALQSITVASGNANYSSDSYGVLYNKDKTELIQYPIGNERTSFTVATPVATVMHDAFYAARYLRNVEIKNTVKMLEYRAFCYCSALTGITLPTSLETIENEAFYSCSSLPSIVIPSGVKRIDAPVFKGCDQLKTITVQTGNAKYADIDGVLYTKSGTKLVEYPIGNPRTTYEVADLTKRIGAYAFANADYLKKIILPETLITIMNDAFHYCNALEEIKIPPFVTSLPYEAFEGCDNLQKVYIPFSVRSIYNYALSCDLGEVYYAGTQEEWDEIDISSYNYGLDEAEMHFCNHPTTVQAPAVAASCGKPGYTAGVQCTACERWLKGHKRVLVPHTDNNSDGVCEVCGQPASEISVGVTKTISLFEGESKKIRFVPLEDGYYNISISCDEDYYDIDRDIYDEDGDWLDDRWMVAGETYYYEFYNWDYEADTTVQVDVTLTKEPAGLCGNRLVWRVQDASVLDGIATKALVIDGYGNMWDYSDDPAPWSDIDGINTVAIGENVGKLSMEAFSSIQNLSYLINVSYETVLAQAFLPLNQDLVIYCYNGSEEHLYCKENGISYRLLDEETEFMYDDDTDVSVAYNPDAFGDTDVSLDVKEKETDNENARSWDIKPIDEDGNIVQPNMPVQIWLPLPENWNGKYLLVTHKHDDGTIEYITNYSINGGYVVFWVSAFSIFTVETQDYPVHEHEYTEEIDLVEPTCIEDGRHTLVCSICGDEKEEIIPATGEHVDEENDGYCDTCGNMMEGDDHCPQCGKIHNGGFFDKLTGFFHRIIYRLTHLFKR